MKKIKAADLYCGAGGATKGVVNACRRAGYRVAVTAINHWPIAVQTHSANFPDAVHHCMSLDAANPYDFYRRGELNLLWASPECIFHSRARGGRPVNDQRRASAFCVPRWLDAIQPNVALIENVTEFMEWGPLGRNGRPLKSKRGQTFRAWVQMIEACGYRIDMRVICAADHGDPTTRERLFIQCVRGRRPIRWPEPSHIKSPDGTDLFNVTRQPWRSARDHVIDWAIKGQLISERKRALKPNTLRRILIGFQRFGLRPFIVPQQSGGAARDTTQPIPTVVGTCRGMGLAEPTLSHSGGGAHSVDEPIPAVTTSGNHVALVEPFLISVAHKSVKEGDNSRRTRSVNEPMPTICGLRGEWASVEPFIVGAGGPVYSGKPRSVDEPLNTVLCDEHKAVVEPFLIPNFGEREGQQPRAHSIDGPLPTVTSHGAGALVEPFVLAIDHQGGNGQQVRGVDSPLTAITTKQRHAIAEPYLVKFYGSNLAQGQTIYEPLHCVTAKDRFGLAFPLLVKIGEQEYALDFRFRMLQPHELARAQGFPDDYVFKGNKTEVVCQIGNANPVGLTEALTAAVLPQSQ